MLVVDQHCTGGGVNPPAARGILEAVTPAWCTCFRRCEPSAFLKMKQGRNRRASGIYLLLLVKEKKLGQETLFRIFAWILYIYILFYINMLHTSTCGSYIWIIAEPDTAGCPGCRVASRGGMYYYATSKQPHCWTGTHIQYFARTTMIVVFSCTPTREKDTASTAGSNLVLATTWPGNQHF